MFISWGGSVLLFFFHSHELQLVDNYSMGKTALAENDKIKALKFKAMYLFFS